MVGTKTSMDFKSSRGEYNALVNRLGGRLCLTLNWLTKDFSQIPNLDGLSKRRPATRFSMKTRSCVRHFQ